MGRHRNDEGSLRRTQGLVNARCQTHQFRGLVELSEAVSDADSSASKVSGIFSSSKVSLQEKSR